MKPIPVNTPVLTQPDTQAVLDCLESGWISSEGPQVAEFESTFAGHMGRNYGIAVSSGTAALDIVVRALGLGPGDEVLVPSMTIISCANAIVNSGATPVPVDCDPLDWNAHLHHFQEHATANTRAIMLVHLYGLCADLDPILSWADEMGLMVIEDASQAIGLNYKDRLCGSFGDCSVLSLYANKLITTGEGGMILCNSERLKSQCRSLRNLCFDPEKRFWHENMGWNYRLTAMQAALGISQLSRLPELAAKKLELGKAYHAAFEGIDSIQIAPFSTSYCRNIYWVFGLVIKPQATYTRTDMISALSKAGVGTRTFFYGLHEQPALLKCKKIKKAQLKITENLSNYGLYLPSGLGLPKSDQTRVIDTTLEYINACS